MCARGILAVELHWAYTGSLSAPSVWADAASEVAVLAPNNALGAASDVPEVAFAGALAEVRRIIGGGSGSVVYIEVPSAAASATSTPLPRRRR